MNFKKILATLLAVVMVLGTTGVSFANDDLFFEIEEVAEEEMVELFGEEVELYATADVVLGDAKFDVNEGVVFDGTNYYASLTAALSGVHAQKGAVLYCKPNADLGTLLHGHVCKNLTVYGNGAYLSGGEQDFEIDMPAASGNSCGGLTEDVTLTVYNLTGAGIWGGRSTGYNVNCIFEDCANMGKVFLIGNSGKNNITITNCTFSGNDISACKVYSNAAGTITLTNVDFSNIKQPVALENTSTGTQYIVMTDCDFDNCGSGDEKYTVPVGIKSSVAGGTSVLTVDSCTFTGTNANKIGQDADILLDYGVGKTKASIVNTTAKVGVETAEDDAAYAEISNDKIVVMTNASAVVATPVAQIGSNFYASLADAVEAVKNGETINLLASLDENVVDINKTNVAFTIDGALAGGSKAEFTGTIQMNIGQNVTIKNIDFVNKSSTSKDFIKNAGSPTGKNYNTTLTVENCSFTGDKSVDTVALRMTHPTLVTVKNCEGTALHSFIQNSGGQNVIFDTVKITDSESGFSVGGVRASTVKNCELSLGEGFGIRYDLATANAVHVVENNKIEAFIPVVARRARAENTSVTFNGTNTFTETNTDGLWMAIGDDEKEYNGDNVTVDNITAPTKCVNVVLNDTGLDYSGIIGAAEAKIGNVLYQTLEAAIAALEEGDTLEIATGEYKGFDLLVDNVTITGMTDDTVITIKSIPYNAFIGVNADGAVVENLNFVIAEDCERTGDYLDGYDSVIGFWSNNFGPGSSVNTGCDVLNCTFVNKHAGINNAIFNFNSFDIIGNTFENFDAGVQVMNDLASMGTVNIEDNTFTKVNTPINVYWGEAGGNDNTLTIADNTFVSAKNADKIHIGIADLATANGTPGIDGVVISGNTFNAETEVDVVNTSTEISLAVKSALEDVENVTVNAKYAGVVAKIDDAYYQTLDAAITAAKTDETIDLLGNTITIKDLPSDPVNGRRWFDTDGKTLTIQNGTLDLTGANVTDAVFRLEKAGTHLVFDNVDIVKGSEGSVNYFVNLQNTDSSVKFNECDFNVVAGCHSVIANTSGGVVEVVDCDIKVEGKNFIYRGGALVKDSTFTSKTGNIINHNEFPSVINNTKAETYRLGIIESTGTIDIINGSYVYAVEVAHYYDSTNSKYSTGLITVDETSTLEALDMDVDLINPDSEGTVTSEANQIYVQFRKTDVGEKDIEGKDVYEIVLAGKGTKGAEKINELASADLTFFFKGEALEDAEMSYFVTPAKGVTLSQTGKKGEEHRYMFNYDGVTKYEETDTEIVIGEITIEGYGSYTLKTEEFTAAGAKNTNAVYATEIRNNIVAGYTPAASLEVNKDMVADDGMVGEITNGKVEVPVRTLTINVTFPNSVKNNVAAYQNMTVKIAGGNVDKIINLGTDYVDADTVYTATLNQKGTADAAAYEIKVDLPFNTAYMVTVEGDGYRTARYTVKLTEAKTLNFWNNVMDEDNMIEVEEDAEATATTKTFLAGDIVKDNQINVYDLSAVVSYFGKGVTVEEAPNYAKYDLDRNGVIDARDVAYVLVSWGE